VFRLGEMIYRKYKPLLSQSEFIQKWGMGLYEKYGKPLFQSKLGESKEITIIRCKDSLNRFNQMRDNMVKIKAKSSIDALTCPDGLHKGVINGAVYNGEGEFPYMQFTVKPEGIEGELRFGFSANLTNNSGLGQFVKRMGFEVQSGKDFDFDQMLNKKISFLTSIQHSEERNMDFVQVIRESVKLDK